MPNTTTSKPGRKAGRPHKDFPLFPHQNGRWCKKVKGVHRYFGKVSSDPKGEAALVLWLAQKDALLAGRAPQVNPKGVTVRQVVNSFLTHKKAIMEAGELTDRTFQEYYATAARLVKAFGPTRPINDLIGDDFRRLRTQIAKQWGPIRLGNEIQRVRSVFKYGYDSGLLDKPVRFGPDFKKPSAKVLRQNRAKAGLRMFEAAEVRAMLAVAGPNMRAMILLGLNCGLGNSDVAGLTFSAVNLKTGWLDYPRPKTGVARRIPLWPETVEAVKTAIGQRTTPKDSAHKNLVFVGLRGKSYLSSDAKNANGYRVGNEFARTLTSAKVKPKRGFYCIRHTFQTIGEGANDLVAVQAVMGHAPSGSDMSAQYRERIDDSRLVAVVGHVRKWLFDLEENE